LRGRCRYRTRERLLPSHREGRERSRDPDWLGIDRGCN
jgi:hypothetical protein